jgi:hypothetical protein
MPIYACLRGGSPSVTEDVNCIILVDALGNGWLCVETNLAEVPQVLEMLRAQPLAHRSGSSAEGDDLRVFVADDTEDLARQLVLNTRPPSEATLPPTWLLLGAFLGGGKVRAACAVLLDHSPLGAFLGVLLGAFLGGVNALALVVWALHEPEHPPEHPVGLLVVLLVGVPMALAGAIVGAVLGVLLGTVLGANRVWNRFGSP